ncbi:MAG: heavy metal sensor histidine kinase [Variovorax sp.]|nr:heavy metal sensor histidine kinase [Variovorax sp.]
MASRCNRSPSPANGAGTGWRSACTTGGEPIAAEHLPRLFDRFYRVDASRAQQGDSGGLGLAIVRSIMQSHGGEVRVESQAVGTRFTLAFPPGATAAGPP